MMEHSFTIGLALLLAAFSAEARAEEWYPTAGYDKAFFIRSTDGRYLLNAGGYLQFQAAHEALSMEEDVTGFTMKVARLQLAGNFAEKWIKYGFLAEFGRRSPYLLDYFVQLDTSAFFKLRAGQFKVPFSREYLVSSTDLQTVGTSIVDKEFSLGRDQGVAIWQSSAGGMLEYSAGVFNGNNINSANKTTSLLYVGRIVLAPMGLFSYSQGDIERSDKPSGAVGAGVAWMPRLRADEKETNTALEDLSEESDVLQATVDAGLKYEGLSFEGDLDYRSMENVSGEKKTEALGVRLQAGYFPFDNGLEFVWRFAWVDPDRGQSKDTLKEFAPGMNYYFKGHNLKLQAAYSYLVQEEKEKSRVDQKTVLLGQLWF